MSGKWSQPNVPHKGWVCETVENSGSGGPMCEMCEAQEIRYVHVMSHAAFDNAWRSAVFVPSECPMIMFTLESGRKRFEMRRAGRGVGLRANGNADPMARPR